MAYKAPGKHYRKGISTREFFKMFPDDEAAEAWFVSRRWPNGVACVACGSMNVQANAKRRRMPYRCREKGCGKQFSVKMGSFMQSSKIGYLDWLYSLYLVSTNLKSISSMKLHRELGISQKAAWHLAHRIRSAWASKRGESFGGPTETDTTHVGGKRRNMPKSKRPEKGRGPVDMAAVTGVKDRATNEVRAQVVDRADSRTLLGFVRENVRAGTVVYTDDAGAYSHMPGFSHESVNHSVAEYVRGMVHTQGIESFWAMLKRAHKGTFHQLSEKHLQRYVDEFAGRHNMRELDTLEQMGRIVNRMERAQLRYADLIGPVATRQPKMI